MGWILGIGDMLLIWLFALIGRASHQEGLDFLSVSGTAAPFMLGWLMIGLVMRMFQRDSVSSVTRAVWKTALAWLFAGAVGLVIRSFAWQEGIAPAFVAITMVTNWIFLIAWRVITALTWSRRWVKMQKDS